MTQPGQTVYVCMVADRHNDPDPIVFATQEAAIEHARQTARGSARRPEDYREPPLTAAMAESGWVFYATWTVEDDAVWVVKREIRNGAA